MKSSGIRRWWFVAVLALLAVGLLAWGILSPMETCQTESADSSGCVSWAHVKVIAAFFGVLFGMLAVFLSGRIRERHSS